MSKPYLFSKSQVTLNATRSTIKFINLVRCSAVQSDGKILVGGSFTNYAGTPGRDSLIRLNSDGTLDTAFCVNASDGAKISSGVLSIAIQSDGKILVGGQFQSYAGTPNRNLLIRLNSDGTLDTAFCANATDGGKFIVPSIIYSIAIQSDGKILVGGSFINYNGTIGRNRLIRLNSDGTLDTAFCNETVDGNKFNSTINVVEFYNDSIFVGGNFTGFSKGGAFWTGVDYLMKLNLSGVPDTTFIANGIKNNKFSSSVVSIKATSSGVLIGGDFINYAGVASRNRLVKLNTDGTTNTAFCTNATDGNKFSNTINSITVQTDNKILVGGFFIDYAGTVNRNRLIRLNSDGTTDTAFCVNASDNNKFNGAGTVYSVSVLVDNGVLVGGGFTIYAAVPFKQSCVKLDSSGLVDVAFCAYACDSVVIDSPLISASTQSNGKIVLGGSFINYAGTANRNRLIQLNSDGTLDTAFCVNAVDGAKFNGTVNSVSTQSDGKVLVGGNFSNYAGTVNRNRLIRLNVDGTLDTAFCVNASDGAKIGSGVFSIAIQSDGKILVGGSFTNYAGTTGRNRLIRLNSDGTLDTAFCANASDGAKFSGTPTSITIQSDNKILLGGSFANYAGTLNRNFLIRLNSDGTTDAAFCVNATDGNKFTNIPRSIKVQSDNKVLICGDFVSYAGTAGRDFLIRLNPDGTTDTAFCVNASDGSKFSNSVTSVKIESNGKIAVSGFFNTYNSIVRRGLIKINSDGTFNSYNKTFSLAAINIIGDTQYDTFYISGSLGSFDYSTFACLDSNFDVI